ncbi:hypothetical protein C8R45DRAFT_1096603 [Mycena sanguinolenta]|nr:hypothetical protein C8R45DRAFT_1096603 [Mycena sanguinolenta]
MADEDDNMADATELAVTVPGAAASTETETTATEETPNGSPFLDLRASNSTEYVIKHVSRMVLIQQLQMAGRQVKGKAYIENLEKQVKSSEAWAQDSAKAAYELHGEVKRMQEALEENKQHEAELETQFMSDQQDLGYLASVVDATALVVESQNQVAAQGRMIEELRHKMAASDLEAMTLRARLNAPVATNMRAPRKGRRASFPVLRNVGTTIKIPLDPVPLPDPPASLDKSTPVRTTVEVKVQSKRTKKGKADGPVAPANKVDVNYWNEKLRKVTYTKLGVSKADDFMHHTPVTPQEVQVHLPENNNNRLDFSSGYMHSRWNRAMRAMIVAEVLQDEEEADVDSRWLDEQLKDKISTYRAKWACVQPKAKVAGGLETHEEAAACTAASMKAELNQKKANSTRERKFNDRIMTVLLTIQIKEHEGVEEVGIWKRFQMILERLGTVGMSSEEEDETDFHGQPVKIYRVKVCVWCAPQIAGYVQLIDKQTALNKDQYGCSGVDKAVRVRVPEHGKSRTPRGLPSSMYNAEWLNGLTLFNQEDLQISEEQFEMLVAATSRMVL